MQIPDVLKNKMVQMTSVAVTAFVGGIGLGYILGQRRERDTQRLLQEIAEIEEQVTLITTTTVETVDVEIPTLIRVYDPEFEKLLDQEEAIAERTQQTDQEPEPVGVFLRDDDDWNYEKELSTRTRETPYVLHYDEFINGEMGFDQETLTYYAGDDIMADSNDTVIYNHEGLMGELKFGHGSNDPAVVYIRNEVIHMEWEILLHETTFTQEVLGVELEHEAEEQEIHHSAVPKFRRE
jgi:hypothetical protein